MDVMEIRRHMMGVIAKMANGVQYITGTITPTQDGPITIPFGKTLSDYFVFIEMTDESITKMANAQTSNYKGYSFMGNRVQKRTVDGKSTKINAIYLRYNPGNSSINSSVTTLELGETGVSFSAGNIENNAPTDLYTGYTYNYIIAPIA